MTRGLLMVKRDMCSTVCYRNVKNMMESMDEIIKIQIESATDP